MDFEKITDNVKYRLGNTTLLICVYDDNGKEIAHELFELGYKGHGRYIKKVNKPGPYTGEAGCLTD